MRHKENGLTVYKASAGSGKTFTLAVEYIKLLIMNPHAYRHILAVTFTNKATGEMKERILGQLYALSKLLPEANPYMERLTAELEYSPIEVSHRAQHALQLIVHDYGRFRVETIDSFFQSVMRNLARELGLSPNLNIELDADKLLGEAIEALLRNLEPHSELMRWILDYIDEKIDDDKRWNITEEIRRFGANLFNEQYMTYGTPLRVKLHKPGYIGKFRKLLITLAKELEDGFKTWAHSFEEELRATSLSPDDLAGKGKGIASYFRKLEACSRLGDKDIMNATLAKSLDDPEAWSTKTSTRRAEITDLAIHRFIPLLQKAEEFRTRYWKVLLSCRLSLTHIYKVGLLTHIDDELHLQNHLHNRFLLGETNNLLHNLIKEGDTSFIFEKTGTIIRHVMIDEFQDTSQLQWNNFRLLLTESLAQGADSIIVGDVKQSIYRWRGGNWEILGELKKQLGHFPIRERTLTINRRSETHVIDFNNFFFTHATQILNKKWYEESGQDCESLLNAYSDVCQQSPRTKKRGHVNITLFQTDSRETYETETLQHLLKCVEHLIRSEVPQRDIAILLRYKKHIPLIASWFSREAPYCRLISNEAFLLQSSIAVEILIGALHSLTYPEDTVTRATLAYQWQTEVKGCKIPLNEICASTPGESSIRHISLYLPAEWSNSTAWLQTLPLHELLEHLFRLFSLDKLEGQDAYLLSFFDGVDEYLQNGNPNPEAFLNHWNETLCKRAIPSGEIDGIRMLSVHASKGLEFHTVLVPFCDWELQSSSHGELVWCAPKVEPFSQMDLVPVNFSSQMADSIYRTEYEHERLQQWVDNLNLLYVTFTRASSNLIIWSKQKNRNGMGELLYEALNTENAPRNCTSDSQCSSCWIEEEDKTLTLRYGEEEYDSPIRRNLSPTQKETAERSSSTQNKNSFTTLPNPLTVRMLSYQPNMKFRQSNRSADFIAGDGPEEDSQREYINRGQLMHTLFSSIRTKNDLQPALHRFLFEGIIDRKEAAEVERLATRALSHPLVQHWYDGSCRLYNECTILYRRNGTTEIRRPDRVMMHEGKVWIVDFKFGTPKPAYQDQVREYMNLLLNMGYPHVEGYLWYVYKNEIKTVE